MSKSATMKSKFDFSILIVALASNTINFPSNPSNYSSDYKINTFDAIDVLPKLFPKYTFPLFTSQYLRSSCHQQIMFFSLKTLLTGYNENSTRIKNAVYSVHHERNKPQSLHPENMTSSTGIT
jgi:hypothetical protein